MKFQGFEISRDVSFCQGRSCCNRIALSYFINIWMYFVSEKSNKVRYFITAFFQDFWSKLLLIILQKRFGVNIFANSYTILRFSQPFSFVFFMKITCFDLCLQFSFTVFFHIFLFAVKFAVSLFCRKRSVFRHFRRCKAGSSAAICRQNSGQKMSEMLKLQGLWQFR